MAKKITREDILPKQVATPKPAPTVETKQAIPRLSGNRIVKFRSNGLAPTMRTQGKVHMVTADNAQVLIDKGYGTVLDA